MTIIGLTGGIAAGKSTAAEMLRDFGATVIDADRLGHRSYEPGTPGFQFHARVQVTDANVVGGAVTSVTATAGTMATGSDRSRR